MKKYKLEISIGLIFAALLTLVMHNALTFGNKPWIPWTLLGIWAAGLVLVLFPEKRQTGEDHERYAPAFFTQTLVSSLVGIGCILAVTTLLNRDRFNKTFDITENKVNSLNDQTLKILSSLEKEVEVWCVGSDDPSRNFCADNAHLLHLYGENAPKLKVNELDPSNPAQLQTVRPGGYSRLVLMTEGNRSEITGQVTEQKLTNGILNLVKFKKVVYFLSGHGEPGLAYSQGRNYADVVSLLNTRAYEAKEWKSEEGDLPSDASVLVAGGNVVSYGPEMEPMFRKFLAKGGRLILTMNPYRETGLDKLLSDVGVTPNNDLLVVNTSTSIGQQVLRTKALRLPAVLSNLSMENPITEPLASKLGSRMAMLVDGARSFTLVDKPSSGLNVKQSKLLDSVAAAPVLLASANDRNRLNIDGPNNDLKPDTTTDMKKGFAVGVHVEINDPAKLAEGLLSSKDAAAPAAVASPAADASQKSPEDAKKDEKKDTGAQILVLGFDLTGPLATLENPAVQILPLAISHFHADRELVSISAKDFAPKQFNLERNPQNYVMLFAFLLPIATALSAFFVWFRRRSA